MHWSGHENSLLMYSLYSFGRGYIGNLQKRVPVFRMYKFQYDNIENLKLIIL